MAQLVLSLFPGIGLLDSAFEDEGFCVVRGPDVLWGGDIRKFHPPAGKFDGVIGGPPCQMFSSLAHMVRQNGHQPRFGNLIPEFERCVLEAQPPWFLMENVPAAPVPVVTGYDVYPYMLNNRQCMDEDGKPATQNRVRRFSWGWRGEGRPPLLIDVVVFENPIYEYAATGGSQRPNSNGHIIAFNRKKKKKPSVMPFNTKSASAFRELCRKQGLPDDFDLPGFTVAEKCRAVGNGVPIPMGRAIARAVREATAGIEAVR